MTDYWRINIVAGSAHHRNQGHDEDTRTKIQRGRSRSLLLNIAQYGGSFVAGSSSLVNNVITPSHYYSHVILYLNITQYGGIFVAGSSSVNWIFVWHVSVAKGGLVYILFCELCKLQKYKFYLHVDISIDFCHFS